jgi:glycosyltransferase involved in cell wall biosynthesis
VKIFSLKVLNLKKFLVVDNASEDDTPKIKELFPEFVIYKRLPKNLGADGGYYYALSFAYKISNLSLQQMMILCIRKMPYMNFFLAFWNLRKNSVSEL